MSRPIPSCPAGVDDSFGPWAGESCRGGFDFTLLFEEGILSLPLQCIFLVALPVRVWHLARTDAKVVASPLRRFKACASLVLLGLNAALVGLLTNAVSTDGITRSRASIPTTALTFVTSLGVCLLSWLEHDRSIRPSFILSVYLFMSILLDLARARTLWMLSAASQTIPVIFTCTMGVRAVMLLLESIEKRNILAPHLKGFSKEETSSTASRSVFFWLTDLFLSGYKGILSLEDLYPLDTRLRSAPLHKALSRAWNEVPNKTVFGVLFSTSLKVLAGPIMLAVIPKLFLIAFTYAQPFLVDAAIDLASQPQVQPHNNYGYGLIGAYVLVYTGIAVSTGQYEWRIHRAATMLKGSLIALVYEKSLRLDITSPNVSPAAALTLVGTDTETIIQGVVMLHDIWGSLLEICIGIYLLNRELGAACAVPVAFSVVVLIVTVILAIPTGKAQAEWIKASENRVTATSKTLGSIKWVRMSGMNEKAFSIIQSLRATELEVSTRFRMLLGVTLMLLICAPIWTPIVTFSAYAGMAANGDSTLTISKAFTAYTLLILVNAPLSGFIVCLPVMAGAVTSCQRIQDHMNGKNWVDNRVTALDEKKSNKKAATAEPTAARDNSEYELAELQTDVDVIPDSDVLASVAGKFSWAEEAEPTLDIENWDIRRRTFTMVLGPVGCAKSTLLKALLGELSTFEGTIRTNYSGVSYCSQTAWLPNDTVRNIITCQEEFDEAWYRDVIHACALEEDIRSWPEGDQTRAGTNGISMSGGQKHRLAIARALYSKREFLILDDIFSGLDAATEDRVFNNLFGQDGLLRAGDTTTVLASSDARRAPYADQILLLTDKGTIRGSGAPAKLEKMLGIAGKEARWSSEPRAESSAIVAPVGAARAEDVLATMAMKADGTRRLGDPATYTFYAKGAGRLTLVGFSICMAIFAFCQSFPSIWLKWWGEANMVNPNSELDKWLGVYAALGVGAVISILFGAWQLFIVVINRSGVYFHDALVRTASRVPMSFHSSVDSGETVNRFSQDLQLIDMELPAAAFGVAVSFSFAVAQFILICYASKYLAAILPLVLAAFYAIQHFYLRTSRQMRLLEIEHKAPLYTQLIETLSGLVTIRAFRWERAFEEKNMALLDDSQRPSYLLVCLQRWLNFAVDMMIAGIALVLIVVTTTLREQVGPGSMGVATSNIMGFSATVKATLTSWILLEVSLGAVARVRSFTAETQLEPDPVGHPAPPEGSAWPSQGAVELRKVTASYPKSGVVLKDISLTIQPGEKVAICGRTGSGKSSLALSLLRMIDLDSGSVTIDGIDLSTLPHAYVRARLAAIPQESYIFDGTVRLNVDPSETASDEEISEALRRVQLWGKVEQRGGLDAVIHDKFFSQGEAQLLVFARAMLHKSKVLILDEFTSSLDDETRGIIDNALGSWFTDWTVIAIVHKLSSILDFDRVAVLDSGTLVEYDRPQTLLSRDSKFRSLYDMSSSSEGTSSDIGPESRE